MRQIERVIQESILAWAYENYWQWPELTLLMAIPNGEHRAPSVALRLKKAGVRPGVPDLLLPVVRGQWHGLWLEVKAPNGKLSPDQKLWIWALKSQGYRVEVVRSLEQTQDVVLEYLMDTKK